MSRDRIYHIINGIIEREGGFVNHKSDRGGPTNMGITQGTLAAYRNKAITISDVENLTKEEAFNIYWRDYVRKPGFDLIHSDSLAEHLVDIGVLHGPQRAVKWLQQTINVEADGVIGPVTLKAVNEGTLLAEEISKLLAVFRIRFMGRLISRDHSQAPFAAGWLNRATEFLT
jgi:lysozyme family protein